MGMRGERTRGCAVTVFFAHAQRPEANDAHVADLNVIENQQDREDNGMESSRKKRTACT